MASAALATIQAVRLSASTEPSFMRSTSRGFPRSDDVAQPACPRRCVRRERFGFIGQLAGQARRDEPRKLGMGAAPDWDRLLELPRTGLGEPHHPSTQIALDDRDLDQALALE